MTQRRALGRGLGSLIPEAKPPLAAEAAVPAAATPYVEIDLDRIDPNPVQPRRHFSEADLEELASSITEHGVVQPVLVRRRGDRFQMVAGERRLRAAQRAGLRKVPAIVRTIADDRMLETALVENIQRQELDPIEEAEAYRTLLESSGMQQRELGERLGKSEASISNSLRLLKLSEKIRSWIVAGTLSAAHGRSLLSVADEAARESLASRVVERGLSARQTEELAREAKRSSAGARTARAETPIDANTRAAEERLMRALGTKVQIRRGGAGGRVEISFHNEEELERIFEYIVQVRTGGYLGGT